MIDGARGADRILRVVLLTHPCERAGRILDGLVRAGVPVESVVLATPSALRSARRLMRVVSLRRLPSMALRRVLASLTQSPARNWRRPEFYRLRAGRVITVTGLNDEDCTAALKELGADIGVVGCARILCPDVFNVFPLGVLNIHPGLIPEYRGRSPVEWALLEGGDAGATLHFIDAGVDTGPIVGREIVPFRKGDTIRAVYRRADAAGIDMLVAALGKAMRGEQIPADAQPPAAKRPYRSVPQHLVRTAQRRLDEHVSRGPVAPLPDR